MRFRDSQPFGDPAAPLVTRRDERAPRKSRYDFEYRGGCEFTDALQRAYDEEMAKRAYDRAEQSAWEAAHEHSNPNEAP